MRKTTLATTTLTAAAFTLPAGVQAQSGAVTIELPRVSDPNYRKPYLAAWLEEASGKPLAVSAVLHDQSRIGSRWLSELRTWWRKRGRDMTMPADGISAPTRAAGRHTIAIKGLAGLGDGTYRLVVEAAREKAGREVVNVPVVIRGGQVRAASAQGHRELGHVRVSPRG
ncbi:MULTISPECIES: DUF2271 domain-containing protein [Novosphingobium]|uniref:DUF2271 domain-containing protein n=1 Tax=Novosphingobium decolorationis TaxID=2698673 RepID=A0ABX8E9I4_9SPHN|nr:MULTISPECIES: DUF2271 domain-containing protein [Novosphingobium]QVM85812.1 DUF2271 domain-containing protein [Novosphingobium decolorationis]GAM07234.1 hypothetical conserved protein [Novosphingobium sp. MBES04]